MSVIIIIIMAALFKEGWIPATKYLLFKASVQINVMFLKREWRYRDVEWAYAFKLRNWSLNPLRPFPTPSFFLFGHASLVLWSPYLLDFSLFWHQILKIDKERGWYREPLSKLPVLKSCCPQFSLGKLRKPTSLEQLPEFPHGLLI